MKSPLEGNHLRLPLDKGLKVDHRGVVSLNQCKVIAVSECPEKITSEEKAAIASQENYQLNLAKLKSNQDFLNKTKERLREKRLSQKKDEKPENLVFGQKTFTLGEEKIEEDQECCKETQENRKIVQEKPKKKVEKSEKDRKKEENLVKDLGKKPKIPRFVSVDNMKIEFNPKIVKNSKKQEKLEIYSQTNPLSMSSSPKSCEVLKELEQTRYSIALKKLVTSKMTEKFPKKNAAVCTCGAASKNTARHPKKCANNCPFYKNEGDYQRALKEMLTSFKASE